MSKIKFKRKSKDQQDLSFKKLFISIFFVIGYTILSMLLFFFILQAILNTIMPVGIAITDSMEPYINKGDLIFIKGVDPAEIQCGTIQDKDGDVIVFDASGLWYDAPDTPVGHRVVQKWNGENGWIFRTKGDANPKIDPSIIPEDRIFGVVCGTIPFIGWIFIYLTNPSILILLIIIAALFILHSRIEIYKLEIKSENTEIK